MFSVKKHISRIAVMLPAKRQSHQPASGGDRVELAAKGHTDSGRLVASVLLLWHDSDAAATGVLQDRAVRHEKSLLRHR